MRRFMEQKIRERFGQGFGQRIGMTPQRLAGPDAARRLLASRLAGKQQSPRMAPLAGQRGTIGRSPLGPAYRIQRLPAGFDLFKLRQQSPRKPGVPDSPFPQWGPPNLNAQPRPFV